MASNFTGTILRVFQQSQSTEDTIEKGALELRSLLTEVRRLSGTLRLLLDESRSSSFSFVMAAMDQDPQLCATLVACGYHLSSLQRFCRLFERLQVDDRVLFMDRSNSSCGGCKRLQARINHYTAILERPLESREYSLKALNHPPALDVLGQIQSELLSEGVPLESLEQHHDQIKDYVRHLAMAGAKAGGDPITNVEALTRRTAKLTTTKETATELDHRQARVANLVTQFSALFTTDPQCTAEPPNLNAMIFQSELVIDSMQIDDPRSPILEYPSRKDSVDPLGTLIAAKISTAISNVALSINLHSQIYNARPPPKRSSSAVFRGLADEERATGE